MKYLSVCSGIEAASVAWDSLGWKAVGFSEIEKFPSMVLKQRYPDVPNFGDMNEYKTWGELSINLLVGGTPCQAFSVAGKREGLADARGNLALTFCRIADHFGPEWVVWENVPGVLIDKENAFGCFLGELCGANTTLPPIGKKPGKWGRSGLVSGPKRTIAWRVLDAQFFGVAQRRRRVFVVAVPGPSNWNCAKALFSVGEGVFWNSPPDREKRKNNSGKPYESPARTGWPRNLAVTLDCHCGDGLQNQHIDKGCPLFVPFLVQTGKLENDCPVVMAHGQANAEITEDFSPSLTCLNEAPIVSAFSPVRARRDGYLVELSTAPTLVAKGGDDLPCVVYNQAKPAWIRCECCEDYWCNLHHVHVFDCDCPPLEEWETDPYGRQEDGPKPVMKTFIRRLTPMECERLQGFPDGYTDIRPNGKPTPDGPRYKALGNSMAVPVMRWIGERIANHADR